MRRSGPPPARPTATAAGTRALIEVLLLHRHLHAADVIAGITAALTVGAVNADVVAVEARKSRRAARQRHSGASPRHHGSG